MAAIERGNEALKQTGPPLRACIRCGRLHTGKFAKASRAACASDKESRERSTTVRYQRQTTDTLQNELDWYQAQVDRANRVKRD